MHRPSGRAGLLPTLVTVVLTVGCAAHPSVPSRPAADQPAVPVSSTGTRGDPAIPAAADQTSAETPDRSAIPTAVTFVRAALGTGPATAWAQCTRRNATTRLRRPEHQAPPAPPVTGSTRVRSAQLADTPRTTRPAQVEVATLATAGADRVPVTPYLTLTRTPTGWLVDAVQSWT